MTTYILAGGADRKKPKFGEKLTAEVHKRIDGPVRVLSCVFAEPREMWSEKFASRKPWLRQLFGDDTETELAFPDQFREQIKRANVIYVHGGDDALLGHYLNQYGDIRELFEGKIVVGSSAGADWLSANFWTCDWRQSMQGSGIVPLNIMVHYGSAYGADDPRGPIDWQKAEAEFQAAIGADKTITHLPEGEFVVVES